MGVSWSTLLSYENSTKQELELEKNIVEDTPTLFNQFIPNPGQRRFLELTKWDKKENPDHKFTAMIAGIGAGKSHAGAVWLCAKALLYPKAKGLVCSNTFGQLSRATLQTLVRVCREFNIPLEPYAASVEDQALKIANCQRCYIGKERTFIYVLSMSSFMGKTESARGLEIRFFWGDELAYSSESAFNVLIGRLGRGECPELKGQGIISTSPNSYNWIWERFADPNRSPEMQNLYKMVQCSTRENLEHLGEDYIQSLEINYSDELFKQELEGQFVQSAVGLVYKSFDRRIHCLRDEDAEILEYDPNLPLLLTFDFNYSPAICLAAQQRQGEIHFCKEWFILDSDIWELTESVTDWIIDNGSPPAIQIFGDATGRARSANSRLSSWDIVTEQLKPITKFRPPGYLTKKFAKSNPYVINRIHSVNLLFKQNRCFVDFVECPNLIKDFEQVTYDGNKDIAKDNPLLSHLSDAAGYLIHSIYPFKREGDRTLLGSKKPKNLAS
jgi:hypothetical protein